MKHIERRKLPETNMKTLLNIDWQPTDPIQYDDAELKKKVCSHIEYALHEDGEYYCKACKICSSDVEVKS